MEPSSSLNLAKNYLTKKCIIFEDNVGVEELARTEKFCPRSKHISVKYTHFCEYFRTFIIKIKRFDTNNQLADVFTKPIPSKKYQKLRKSIHIIYIPK